GGATPDAAPCARHPGRGVPPPRQRPAAPGRLSRPRGRAPGAANRINPGKNPAVSATMARPQRRERAMTHHDDGKPLPLNGTSLTRCLIEEQRAGRIGPDLRLLIEVVARACKRISITVGKGALGGVLGDAGGAQGASINIQGEAQKKLDVLSNEILLEANAWGVHLAALASEEMDHSQPIPDVYPRGSYLLLFDPLDGSSNIDVNVSVGTIFSVLRSPEGVTTPGDEHFLQPGTAQVAAGYCV